MTHLALCIVLVIIIATVCTGSAAKTNFSCECLVVSIAVTWELVWWDMMLCGPGESYQTFVGTH
jgi:uncharacterized membrane protein YjdF